MQPPFSFDFNPRSRVGNDVAGDVTLEYETKFQSTFPRGERHIDLRLFPALVDFNPRSRVGNDGYDFFQFVNRRVISIHVPAWGTTLCACVPLWEDTFQSTFPRGERQHGLDPEMICSIFQSTFPRGERRKRGLN